MLKNIEQKVHAWLLAWADSFKERAKKPVLWPAIKTLLIGYAILLAAYLLLKMILI